MQSCRQHDTVFRAGLWWLEAKLKARAASVFISLLSLCIVSAGRENVTTGHGRESVRSLEVGHTVEGQLATGEERVYGLPLSNGRYVRFRVAAVNPGPNLQITLFNPEGREIEELSGPVCPFSLSLVAADSGTYRIRVQLLRSGTSPGKYTVQVDELHEASEQDRMRATASSALVEAYRMKGPPDVREQAVQKAEEAISLFRGAGDRRGEAEVFQVLSFRSFLISDYQAAVDYLEQSRRMWHDLADYNAEAANLYSMANYLGRLGESEKRLAALNEALRLQQMLGDRWGQAMALDSLSDAYDAKGELQEALNVKRQALSIFQTNHQEIDYEYTALADVGHIYEELGDPQKALDYHRQALNLARSHHNRDLEIPMLSVIAGTYDEQGDSGKALEYYHKALTLSRGDKGWEAWTQSKLAGFYLRQGENEKALRLFDQLLPYFHSEHSPVFEAATLSGFGIIYHRQGKLPQALEALNQALSVSPFKNRGRREILREIGAVYQDLGDSQKSLEYYEKSLSESRNTKDLYEEASTLCDLARLELAVQQLEEARGHVEAGLQILESVRARIAGPEMRSSYFAAAQTNFEFYIDLLMQMHAQHPEQGLDAIAFQVSERARARSLLDMLAEAGADIHQGVDPQLLEQQKLLQQRLRTRSEYQVQLLMEQHTSGQATAVASELQTLTAQYEEIEARIRDASPHYAALTQPKPLDLRQIQDLVLDPETLLLEYALGKNHSYLWAVTNSSLASFTLPGRSEIEWAARRVHELLTARNTHPQSEDEAKFEARIARATAAYPAAAGRLSDLVLGPVMPLLQGKRRLLIVNDGALQFIPFGALPVRSQAGGPNQPLVVESEIVTTPSATTIAVLRRELAGRQPAAKTVAVLADPVFDREDPRVAGSRPAPQIARAEGTIANISDLPKGLERSWSEVRAVERGRRIPRLAFSRREADAIIANAPPGSSFKALDFRANRVTATSPDLAQYRIVHFATHGVLDSRTPALSGIVLSLVDRQGKPVDGFLRLLDIYNLRLPVDLVVLSACQTALGKEIKGEGLVGLTRGFMYAGAGRVLASLWQVDDAATAELMGSFYQGVLKNNLSPPAALRAAQIQMWKQPRWKQDPYFWAAFQLQGEWR